MPPSSPQSKTQPPGTRIQMGHSGLKYRNGALKFKPNAGWVVGM